jgi:hypothetical protein
MKNVQLIISILDANLQIVKRSPGHLEMRRKPRDQRLSKLAERDDAVQSPEFFLKGKMDIGPLCLCSCNMACQKVPQTPRFTSRGHSENTHA